MAGETLLRCIASKTGFCTRNEHRGKCGRSEGGDKETVCAVAKPLLLTKVSQNTSGGEDVYLSTPHNLYGFRASARALRRRGFRRKETYYVEFRRGGVVRERRSE